MNKSKVAVAIAAAIGAAGAADAATVGVTLINVATGSTNGESSVQVLSGQTSGMYDTVSGIVTMDAGTTSATFNVSPTATLMTHTHTDWGVGAGGYTATGYTCTDGTFGDTVGASICGNYSYGPDFVNNSSTNYATIPGTRTMAGDDTTAGPQQQGSDYAMSTASFSGGQLVMQTADWVETGSPSTAGIELVFAQPPESNDDGPILVAENTTVNIDVLANDNFIVDDINNLTTTVPTSGTATVIDAAAPFPSPQAGVTVDFTSPVGFSGVHTFTYEVTDANNLKGTATVTVSNLLPIAVDDYPNVSGHVTTPVEADIPVAANDTYGDTTPGIHDVSIIAGPSSGTIGTIAGCDVKATCVVPYTPNTNYFGPDSFTYQLQDGNGDTDTALVTIAVVSGAAPSATDDDIVTDTMAAIEFNPLTNDVGLGNMPLSIVFEDGTGGAVTETAACISQAACRLTYTPNSTPTDFVGTDSFTYTIEDSNTLSDTGTVNVFVNDLPVAVADPMMTAVTAIATPLDVQANDTGLNDAPVSIAITTAPTDGSATPGAGLVTYTSAAGFNGTDTFQYELLDNKGNPAPDTSNITTVTVTVDDQPVAVDNGTMGAPAFMIPEGSTDSLDVLANDTGLSDTPLAVSIISQGALGVTSVSGSPGNASAIRINYIAGPSSGIDSFDYQITDQSESTATATVWVAVTDLDFPMAIDDTAMTSAGIPVTVNVLENDAGLADTPLTVTITTNPTNGVIGTITNCDQKATCEVPYTPNAGFTGDDDFQYMVTDDTPDNSGNATVTITVTETPVAVDDAVSVFENENVTIDVLSNDTEIGNVPLTVTINTPPGKGTAVVQTDNTIVYTPNGGEETTDTFDYTVTDNNGGSSTAQVNISITGSGGPIPPQNTLPGQSSAIGPASMALLLGLPLLRSRRRKR